MQDSSDLLGLLFCCFYGFFWIIFILIFFVGFIFWVLMLIDAVKKDFKDPNDKVVWIVILALSGLFSFGWLGALIYYFAVKRNPKYN